MHRNPVYMTMRLTMAATLAATALSLGACQERKYNAYLHARDTVTLNAGDAVAHNKAVHTIDPWPAHARNNRLSHDGSRMVLAVDRYKKNESLEPQGLSTNNIYEDQKPPFAPPAAPGGPTP